jgi:membrane protein YqaA with SNARE-associated domain
MSNDANNVHDFVRQNQAHDAEHAAMGAGGAVLGGILGWLLGAIFDRRRP